MRVKLCQLTEDTYDNRSASNRNPGDTGDQGGRLVVTDANSVGFDTKTGVTDIDIVISRGEIQAGTRAQGDVM